MLKLNIQSITEDRRHQFWEVPADLLALDPDILVTGPVRVDAEIYRRGREVFLRGLVSASLELTCARCLEPFQYELEGKLDLVAVPADSPKLNPEQADAVSENEDTAFLAYTGDQLDLAAEVRAVLILAIPMKPLCDEKCPGLCPQCGSRLTAGHCHCTQAGSQGPFAVLEKIRRQPPAEN